jgi:periplasmic protein TonB
MATQLTSPILTPLAGIGRRRPAAFSRTLPTSSIAVGLTLAAPRQRPRRHVTRPARTASAISLSLLWHAAALLVVVLLVPDRAELPAAAPEASIALVFAPSPVDAPTPAEQSAPAPTPLTAPPAPDEASHEELPADAPAVAAAPPSPAPATPPVVPIPVPTPEPAIVPTAPPQAAKAPSPKPTAAAHARNPLTSPLASRMPPRTAAPAETQSSIVGSTAVVAAVVVVPPRPVAGMATNRAPAYPESARRRREQGRVELRVNVSADGMPIDVSVAGTSGYPSLDAAAQSAVRQWRFIPATQAGRSVAAIADVPIQFRLDD